MPDWFSIVPNAFPCGSEDIDRRYRGYLPHLEGRRRCYFVTFRLADSLPREVQERLRERRAAKSRQRRVGTARTRTGETRPAPFGCAQGKRDAHPSSGRAGATGDVGAAGVTARIIEEALDHGSGACHLRRGDVAGIVASAIRHFDGERYRLYAWCVMPNHVHVVLEPLGDWKLAQILHSWKSFTAHRANRLLRRSGEFWQREYYDRMLRDGREFLRAVAYVAENPRKAGLRNWPWVWTYLP